MLNKDLDTNTRRPDGVPTGFPFESHDAALQAVRDSYDYWTGELTHMSLQLSYAIIAANWAVFGSVDQLLGNFWSRLSIGLVILQLGLTAVGTKLMGEMLCERIRYAEKNYSRWQSEFDTNAIKPNPWPWTKEIELLAKGMREVKIWLPVVAGGLFIVALILK
jgi:hypothetical protein